MKKTIDCRSALFMPASNSRLLPKGPKLSADAIIIDLEDAVTPSAKVEARKAAIQAFSTLDYGYRLRALRINDAGSDWHAPDLDAVAQSHPDAVVLPKAECADDIARLSQAMDKRAVPANTMIWAMIESPQAVINANSIAESCKDFPRLSCLLVGNNDMARAATMPVQSDRTYLIPWLMTILAAAKSQGVAVLDSVYNDFADLTGLETECEQARMMGMDGKLVIHPSQLAVVNTVFSPSPEALADAQAIVATFALEENAGKGVISIDGRMIERLHLDMAKVLLKRAAKLALRN